MPIYDLRGSTPYKQAYVIACENGQIWLSVVMGEDTDHGIGLSITEVSHRAGCQVWDSCAYPTTPDLKLGYRILRGSGIGK